MPGKNHMDNGIGNTSLELILFSWFGSIQAHFMSSWLYTSLSHAYPHTKLINLCCHSLVAHIFFRHQPFLYTCLMFRVNILILLTIVRPALLSCPPDGPLLSESPPPAVTPLPVAPANCQLLSVHLPSVTVNDARRRHTASGL